MSSGTEGEVYEYRDHEPRKRGRKRIFLHVFSNPGTSRDFLYFISLSYIIYNGSVCIYNEKCLKKDPVRPGRECG